MAFRGRGEKGPDRMGSPASREPQTGVTNFLTTHGENITFHALLPIHRKILLKPGGLFIQFKQMMIKDLTHFEKNPESCSPAGVYPECGEV